MNSAPSNSISRPLALVFLLFIIIAAAFWLRAPNNPDVSHGAQLFLNTPELEPTTTFEVRFDDTIIGANDVGSEAKESPLLITPALPGTFTWLSRRSGVYTPTQPPTLATRYTVSLRSGLRTASGEPLRAELRHAYATPPFQFNAKRAWSTWNSSETNAPALPDFVLSFNELVSDSSARGRLRYRDAEGHSVAAQVEHPQRYADGYSSDERPWHQRFNPTDPPENEDQSMVSESVSNRLVVTPARPLPPGKGWRLIIDSGIASADGAYRTTAAEEAPIGDVQPLIVKFAALNNLNQLRQIRVSFNKPLRAELLGTNLLPWFTVEPPVENFKAEVATSYSDYPDINLSGSFGLGTNYTVTIKGDFPSVDGFKLAADVGGVLEFQAVEARAFLPSFSNEQLSGGRRAFEFLSVNCSNLTLRSKRIEPGNLVHALRGYRSYGHSYQVHEPQPLDYNAIPGQTVYKTNFATEPPVDENIRHTLDWTPLLGGRQHGTALLEAENNCIGGPRRFQAISQTLVQLTDLGLLWKRGDTETLVWCFSYATGQPVPDATIALVSDENETLAEQITDASGLARFSALTNAVWVRAVKADDSHAIELSNHRLSTWSWRWRQNWSWDDYYSGDEQSKTLLFTERKVYSPGDTVFAKGIMREVREGRLELPSTTQLQLRCTDSRETQIFRTNIALSDLGSFDVAIHLPVAPLGTYSLRASQSNGTEFAATQFEVAEYKPNAFAVKLTPKPSFAAGERIEIPLSASYYFGKSLSASRVRWRVLANDQQFQPAGFEEFSFAGDYWPRGGDENPSSSGMDQSEQSLDKQGRATFTPAITCNPRFPQPRSLSIFAEVTDQNQQTISESAESVLHASAFYLGARIRNRVVRTNEPALLDLIAVNTDGTPRAGGLPVHATLKQIKYHTIRVLGVGDTVSFRNEREEIFISETNIATEAALNLGTRWDVAADAAPSSFSVGEAGDYIIELRAQDSAGHDVLTVVPFYVSADASASFAYRDDTRLELVPDKDSYRAGDTARILIKTLVSGPALVTVERNRVLRHFNVELSGNAPSIEIPLNDDDAPNVFASVTVLRGADKTPRASKLPEYRYGYCQLLVESRATRLDVAVNSARTDYLPGETVEASAEVKDGFGAPVRNAEVTLYAVDEGVLSLTGYKRPAPQEFFLRPQAISVSTGISIDNLIPENPDELRFGNKGFIIGGGGVTDVRKNFAACAFWSAALRTDATGKVTASFKAPDNLTRFRIVAVAHTAHQFGGGESGFNINKPVMIEPALPRFANVGDAVTLRAIVHNKSKHSGEVRVELALDSHAAGAPVAGGAATTVSARTLELSPNASGFVEFPVRFTEPGTAKWTWRATLTAPDASPFTDAVETKLDVGWPQPLLRETHLANSTVGRVNLLAEVGPQLLEGRGTIHVRVANTRLIELSESVSHLLHYPYGCAEQTASALLPWVLLDNFPSILPPASDTNLTRDKAASAGIARLLSMQCGNGGIGYWPGGEASPWASAYAGFVLALAPQHGLSVSSNALQRLAGYLQRSLKGTEAKRGDEVLAERGLALLALAELGRPDSSYHEILFRKRDELSRESRALLALVILRSHGPTEMAEKLLDETPSKRAEAESLFTCPERELALRLAALSLLRPRDSQIDTLVSELMKAQKDGRWLTTQGNAWSLFALTEYTRLVEGIANPARGTLAFNGQSTPVTLASDKPADFDFEITPGSAPALQLECEQGKLYTSMSIESRSAQPSLPRQDRGFGMTRSYELLGPEDKLREFKDARVGDTVVVTLSIDVHQTSHYVAVDDALPAVMEAVNPSFKTAQTSADSKATDWFSDFKQMKTDRVQFFCNHLSRGLYKIRYLARVRAPGDVAAPGTKVEEMYHPERFGFSGTERISTKPSEQ